MSFLTAQMMRKYATQCLAEESCGGSEDAGLPASEPPLPKGQHHKYTIILAPVSAWRLLKVQVSSCSQNILFCFSLLTSGA